MKYLVTGGAGFIGFHTARRLLNEGHEVIIVDNFNDYYDIELKEHRISKLPGAIIYRINLEDFAALQRVFEEHKFDKIIHLAAQAGVRYSLTNPHLYVKSNIEGTMNVFECAKKNGNKHIVYASSSSVYGGNTKIPFSESDPVDNPISLYAATKRSNELMAYTYYHLYGIRSVGLRFFTVYGPYGRPDMAAWLFAKNILNGEEISVFNNGHMKRDFTFVTDIVDGILKSADLNTGYEILNLGNNRPVELDYFIELIEKNLGKKSKKKNLPLQPGDVPATWADITKAKKLLNWEPKISIEEGVREFISWYSEYDSQ